MSSATKERSSLHAPIVRFLDEPWADKTHLGQAYLSLESRNPRVRKSEQAQHPVSQAIHQVISFSGGEFKWTRKPVTVYESDVRDRSAMLNLIERHVAILKELYDIADRVLDDEARYSPTGKYIDSHDIEHIRRALAKVHALSDLSATHNPGLLQLIDELAAALIVVQHDSGLPITGRNTPSIPHELVGSILTPNVLQADPRLSSSSNRIARLPDEVATATLLHVTKNYDYDLIKREAEQSRAYALAVLADETDISRLRTTQPCLEACYQGANDQWFDFNYLTQFSEWECNKQSGCPELVLSTYIGEAETEKMYRFINKRRLERGQIEAIPRKTIDHYLETLSQLLLTPRKVGLFKSACKALFGDTKYGIVVKGYNSSVLKRFDIT